jgi:hypothetical protein
MVATMHTTIPLKLLNIPTNNNKNSHIDGSKYFDNLIYESNWVIRESKKRMGPIASNQLILNTCHSTSIMNATKKLPPTTVP